MPTELVAYKRELIELMVEAGVLRFGDFVLKSGRRSPYFVNTGLYRTGAQMRRLTALYARCILEHLGDRFDVIFGPAYKGIPLAVGTSMAIAERTGRDVAFCFDRKQAKEHGEGGVLVGHVPADGERVLIVEDVTTAGTSIRETVPVLRAAAQVRLAGLVVSVDRMERGSGDEPALVEVARVFAMPTFAIVTIREVIDWLHGRELGGQVVLGDTERERMEAYLREHAL